MTPYAADQTVADPAALTALAVPSEGDTAWVTSLSKGYYFFGNATAGDYEPDDATPGWWVYDSDIVETVDAHPYHGYHQLMPFFGYNSLADGQLVYQMPDLYTVTATESWAQVRAPGMLAVHGITVNISQNTMPTLDTTFTLRKNGVDTGLALVVGPGEIGQLHVDGVVECVEGDLISVSINIPNEAGPAVGVFIKSGFLEIVQ